MKKILLLLLFLMPLASMAQSNSSFQYEGKIGSYPIHMQLFFRSDYTVTGYYYYDSQRARGNESVISVRGIYTGDVDNGQISLKEYGTSGKEIGSFFCNLNGGHETDLESGIRIELHWIEGGSGYRNYRSGKVYNVELQCSEIYEIK